jgi:hypothetical protein
MSSGREKNSASKKKCYKIFERLLYNPKVNFPALISPVLGQNVFSLPLPDFADADREKRSG